MFMPALYALPAQKLAPLDRDSLPFADVLPGGVAGLLVAALILIVAVKLVARLARTAAKVAVVVVAFLVLTGGTGYLTGLFG